MKKQLWNDHWKAWEDFNAFSLVFAVNPNALDVDIPFDFAFYKGQKVDSINQGRTGSIDGGVYNYYKSLNVPKGHYELLFEGNSGMSQVYVNGSLAGESHYPYNRFYVDITPYLNFNEDNDILVVVKTLDSSTRWYLGSGITRNVYLIELPDTYIVPDSFRLTTLDIEEEDAFVKCEVTIKNNSPYTVHEIISFENLVEDTFTIHLAPFETYHFEKNFLIENVEFWDDQHPNLYEVTCHSKHDFETLITGFRKLQFDTKHGFRVNGKEVKLRGGCIHHDQGILGAATYEDYELFRVTKMKEAGFNAIRSAHNPASQALLNACDQVGMYVMDEGFDIWFKMKNNQDYSLLFEQDYKEVLKLQVNGDYNHPCVIMYSTGNEISNINTLKGFETSKKLTDLYHQLDATRPVTNGINGAFACGDDLIDVAVDLTGKDREYFVDGDINKFMAIVATQMDQIVVHPAITKVLEKLEPTMDIMGYNYMTARYLNDSKTYSQRLMVGTETYPKQIYQNVECMKASKAVIGDFTWTGYDYLGEVGKYPALINEGGDVSFLGERRPISYYRKLTYGLTDCPYIAIRRPDRPRMFGPWKMTDAKPVWHFEEGEMTSVEVYASSPTVELFLNGESLGIKKTSENIAFYDVNYTEGELKVKAYNNDHITRFTLKTPGVLDGVNTIIYEGNNIDIVEITLKDKNGMSIDYPVVMRANGDILAFASYNQLHPFTLKEITVNEGRALLIYKHGNHVSLEINDEIVFDNSEK